MPTFLHQMYMNFSDGLYTMWVINIVVGAYALYVMFQFIGFLAKHQRKLGDEKILSGRIMQAFSGAFIAFMFLWADIWAMFYYTSHTLSPLEFFFYAFDAAVLRHLSEEARRFLELTK